MTIAIVSFFVVVCAVCAGAGYQIAWRRARTHTFATNARADTAIRELASERAAHLDTLAKVTGLVGRNADLITALGKSQRVRRALVATLQMRAVPLPTVSVADVTPDVG